MRNLRVQRLSADNITEMRALNGVFARCFEDPATYQAKTPDYDYLRGLLAKPHIIVLTAWQAGRICGGLVAYELEKLEQARSEIYIYDLAVDVASRRQGVATALIAEVSEIAKSCGAWVSFVQADYQDAPAVALYDKLGQREEVLHFDIPPAGKPTD